MTVTLPSHRTKQDPCTPLPFRGHNSHFSFFLVSTLPLRSPSPLAKIHPLPLMFPSFSILTYLCKNQQVKKWNRKVITFQMCCIPPLKLNNLSYFINVMKVYGKRYQCFTFIVNIVRQRKKTLHSYPDMDFSQNLLITCSQSRGSTLVIVSYKSAKYFLCKPANRNHIDKQ